MQPIRSVRNQYRGINAHLHSFLQNEGGWSDFHARHIIHLADTLKAQLRGRGYTVAIEESLQIKRLDGQVHQPESDVLVYDAHPLARAEPGEAALLDASMTIAELLAEGTLSDKPFRSLVIYRSVSSGKGDPVVWIELLSPSNKGSGEDAQFYRAKRIDILAAGLVFVEMDYLHETPPTFPTIKPYRLPRKHTGNSEGHPYRIVILDPRQKQEKGPAWVKSFAVDQPFPEVTIPLAGADTLKFDFGIPYAKTFEEGFLGDQVDYSTLPLHFEHYNPADQKRIAARMVTVLQAARNGIDLETGPFPTADTDLDEALKQIKALRNSGG
jgi:Protein of unknown function (DUF4058)